MVVHSKHVEHVWREADHLWENRCAGCGKTGGNDGRRHFLRNADLQIEPIVPVAVVADQRAVGGVIPEDLPHTLVRVGKPFDFVLVQAVGARCTGIMQSLDDLRLLTGEGKILITINCRSKSRTLSPELPFLTH